MDTKLFLVDDNDKFLGYASYFDCHRGYGKRHRAFVTLLLDSQNRLILQKRKHRLFNGLWDMTAISHTFHLNGKDEDYQIASDRALKEEMGIKPIPVKKIGAFNYFAKDGQGCENEYCAILIGHYNGPAWPNKDLVYQYKKIPIKDLYQDISKNGKEYTPWARLAIDKLYKIDF